MSFKKTLCKILNSVVQFPCIYPDDVFFPSGRSSIKASSVWTTRSFRPDVHLCPEASNCSRLHSSGRLSHMSRHLSVFDKLTDFFPKHRYGKTVATVRTMWLLCPDAILYKASRAEDGQLSEHQTPCSEHSSLNMEIACSWSATAWTLRQYHQDAALCRKEFQANLESWLHSCLFGCPQLPSWRRLGKTHQTRFRFL